MLYGLGARTQAIAAAEVGIGAGAQDSGCCDGPAEFWQHAEAELRARGLPMAWRHMPQSLRQVAAPPLDVVASTARWTARVTQKLATEGDRFLHTLHQRDIGHFFHSIVLSRWLACWQE